MMNMNARWFSHDVGVFEVYLSYTIHVWFIYLLVLDNFPYKSTIHVGKYTIFHGGYGFVMLRSPSYLQLALFNPLRSLIFGAIL